MTAKTAWMNLPPYERRVLDNGLRVVVMERRHLPTLSATLLLPAGVTAEPADLPGTAFFTSQVLNMGTHRRNAVALAEDVDGIGAALSTGSEYDYATVDVCGLSRHGAMLLDILAEVVQSPALLEEEVERRRSQILGMLERRKDDHSDVVRNRFFDVIYGSHPYHQQKEGTTESVGRITREDLARFYGRAYVPDGAILALVGDLDAKEGIREAVERFAGWPRSSVPTDPLPGIPERGERSIVTVQQTVTQAYIRMGNVAIPRNHPDYHAAVIMNYILGGAGFGSRLMRNLREERGLTYGVYSNFWTRRDPGYFFIATQTRCETMNEAAIEILREVERFLDHGATADELDWAKKYFTGSLPLSMETNDQLAQKVLEQEFYGLPDGFWLKDLRRMQEVTVEEVREVARRQIHPDRFAIVVLADFTERELRL